MMKYCCLIVFIFCTIGVSNGGILSGICNASNGTCGKKGVPCNQTFGSEWTYTGKCCNERPCCKFLKPQCVPETCPEGYRLLPNNDSSTSCYLYGDRKTWEEARSICASTPGAYLWRPNTEQEANYVNQELILPNSFALWTGANDRDGDGTFTFYKENGPFSKDLLPFGSGGSSFGANEPYVTILYISVARLWFWTSSINSFSNSYICEYERTTLKMIKTGILTALYLVFTLMILGCAAQNETVTEPNAAVTQCISSVILSACVLIAYKLM